MVQQYFSDHTPATDADLRILRTRARGFDLEMWTSDKVFSGSRLDLGTRQLLAEAPPLPPSGTFLDLGCGWGPLAVTMALESSAATVWAVDVNSRALDLTKRNAELNEAGNIVVLPADQALERAHTEGIRFSTIWSNPPIRIGKDAMRHVLLSWLTLLQPNGHAYLVVQKNLGADSLISWLSSAGFPARKIASKKGYRIIEVSPTPSGDVVPS